MSDNHQQGYDSSSGDHFSPIKELFEESLPRYFAALLIFLFFLFLAWIVPTVVSFLVRRLFKVGAVCQEESGSHIKSGFRRTHWLEGSHWDDRVSSSSKCKKRKRRTTKKTQNIQFYEDVIMEIAPLSDGKIANNVIRLIYFIIQLIFIVFGIVVAFHIIGVHILIIAVPLGISSLIITYGVKDIFSGVAGCIQILSEDIIDIGDQIEMSGKVLSVKRIGVTHTICDTETDWVLVPNAVLVTNVIFVKKPTHKSVDVASTPTTTCTTTTTINNPPAHPNVSHRR